ncbi:ion channel [Bradyrhizobium sp. Ec3.3]|uniref:ion channel n=1 Tax=Bradyrhizobium sp. Ec3.3 TaxID=189753 RepID=UPI0018DBC353|nr:ion channel [Bradyrhizobium sp. Ec3.3]
MEMLDNPSWRWGLSLIVLTMTIHATVVLIVAFVGMRIRVQLETRNLDEWNLIAILICATGLVGLLLAVLHLTECGIWAAVYLWVGALDSPTDALFYSVESMATLGASGLTLQRPWQMMGGLEAVNGMILFGVSTAYLFAMMQVYWSMLAKYVTSSNG